MTRRPARLPLAAGDGDVHGRGELAGRQQNADVWAGDHLGDHHAGVPAGAPPTTTTTRRKLMAPDPRVCRIDPDYDRANASDGVSRYGAYLAGHARLFDPWDEGGITPDPVEFTAAAFRVATGPVMSPGYVRWHGRVIGHTAARGEEDGRLVVSVTLACPSPARLPWSWRGWEREFGGCWVEPRDDRPAALARLELRWPVATGQLHRPAPPIRPGVPNLRDATRAVAVLVGQVNATAGPVLADLEAGR